jgi:protein-disulfide isomerase
MTSQAAAGTLRSWRAIRRTRGGAVALAIVVAFRAAAGAQAPSPPVIASAVADANAGTVTITGAHFGTRPFVTLDLVPLEVRAAIDTMIVAVAPIAAMPEGEYLLTVSRGSAAGENGSHPIRIGAADPSPASPPAGPPAEPLAPLAPEQPVARVGDRVITMADVDREWRRTDPAGYLRFNRQSYDVRRSVLETMVNDELLAREARARSVSVEALLAEEIPKRRITLPDAAVSALYQSLGDSTRGASLDQMRPALRAWLERNTEPELAKMAYIEELKKLSTPTEILLTAPRVRIEHSEQDPSLGPPAAAVELIVFGDFQSSEYATLAREVARMRETFGDRLRIVFKHLPTRGPESTTAAEAAQCAHAQARFWPYHDALLAQPGPVETRMAKAAAAAALDDERLRACLESGSARRAIDAGLEEAARHDVRSSPSLMLNGRLAPAPPPFLPPFDFLKRLIEEELAGLAKARR